MDEGGKRGRAGQGEEGDGVRAGAKRARRRSGRGNAEDERESSSGGETDEFQDEELAVAAEVRRAASSTSAAAAAAAPGGSARTNCCPICLEPWAAGGVHRICCLRCGHLFGRSCILRSLRARPSCPTCKAAAKRSHVRLLFVDTVAAMDTAALDGARADLLRTEKDLATARYHCALLERRLQGSTAACRAAVARLAAAEARVAALQSNAAPPTANAAAAGPAALPAAAGGEAAGAAAAAFSLVHEHARPGGRLVAVDEDGVLCCGAAAAGAAGDAAGDDGGRPSFGVAWVRRAENDGRWVCGEVLPLHSGEIRDVAVLRRSGEVLVLTVSMDKTAVVSNAGTGTVLCSLVLPHQVWSCSWGVADGCNVGAMGAWFCVGTARGEIFVFAESGEGTWSRVGGALPSGGAAPIHSMEAMPGSSPEGSGRVLFATHGGVGVCRWVSAAGGTAVGGVNHGGGAGGGGDELAAGVVGGTFGEWTEPSAVLRASVCVADTRALCMGLPCTGVSVSGDTVLAAHRSRAGGDTILVMTLSLSGSGMTLDCRQWLTGYSSQTLQRPCFVPHAPHSALAGRTRFVGSGDHESCGTVLWDYDSGAAMLRLPPASSPPLCVAAGVVGENVIIATAAKDAVHVFTATPQQTAK